MSQLMNLTVGALWLAGVKSRREFADGESFFSTLAADRAPAPVPRSIGRWASVTERTVRDHLVRRVVPHAQTKGLELLYLPGGAYVHPMTVAHWWIIRSIAQRTGAAVTILQYPLAPEHTVDDTSAMIDAVYEEIAADPSTQRLFVAGDSAGGNAAITLALRMRNQQRRRPDGLVLLAPWVDLSLSNPGAWRRQRHDPTLRCPGLRVAGAAWAGGRPIDDPLVSPLHDALQDLPRTLVFQGARDIACDDVIAFTRRARAAGSPVTLCIARDGFHGYPGAFWTREARHAYEAIQRMMA